MPGCPHCQADISGRDLGRQAQFRAWRVCDHCGGRFCVDRKTRRRQMIAIGIALISLAFTLLLYYDGNRWLLPAIASYIGLAAWILHANRLLFLVPYPDRGDDENAD